MCDEKDYRFPDAAARAIDRSIGVYGGGMTPGVTLRTSTALPRGTELFHRPELHRPWRSSSAQRHAEVLVTKEQEVEVLTRKNDELRSQLAVVTSNLHNMMLTSKADTDSQVAKKENEIERLRAKLRDAEDKLSAYEKESEHRFNLIRVQHTAEIAAVNKKLTSSNDAVKDMSVKFSKQLEDIKATTKREVEMVQKLCHIRTGELTNEITASNEEKKRLSARASESLAEVHAAIQQNDQSLMSQLKHQESRFDFIKSSLEDEVLQIKAQRDKAVTEHSTVTAQCKVLSNELNETEIRCRDWNSRLLSDLEYLNNYFASMMKDMDGCSVTIPTPDPDSLMIYNVYVPPRLTNDMTYRKTMESIASVIYQMMWMKEYHSNTFNDLIRKVKKIECLEPETADQNFATQKILNGNVYEQYCSLVSQVQEVKTYQKRLQSAMIELKDVFSDTEGLLSSAITRLNFFNDDFQKSIECPTNCVVAPRGVVSFAALCVEGAAFLWDQYPSLYGDSVAMLNKCIRCKLAQYGGYECISDGDCFMACFQDATCATKFGLEVQTWTKSIPWPKALLDLYHASEEVDENGNILHRGLRLQIGLHMGEVGISDSAIPVGVGKSTRVHYFGKVIIQTISVASIAVGGEIVASSDLWNVVKPHEVGSPHVTSIGDHNIGGGFGSEYKQTLFVLTPKALITGSMCLPKSGTAVMHGPRAISPAFEKVRHDCIETEVQYLKQKYEHLTTCIIAIDKETRAVSSFIQSIDNKVRDARVGARKYTQEDAISHASAIGRISSFTDLIVDEVKCAGNAQEEIGVWLQKLENTLSNFTRLLASEVELHKKVLLSQQFAKEKLHEQSMQRKSHPVHLNNISSRSDDHCSAMWTQEPFSHLLTLPDIPMIISQSGRQGGAYGVIQQGPTGNNKTHRSKSGSHLDSRSKSASWR